MLGTNFKLNPRNAFSLSKLAKLAIAYLSPAIFAYIVIESASVICISKAKDKAHRPLYNSTTVVLAAEVIKFVISFAAAWKDDPGLENFKKGFTWETYLPFGVPALLYAINNNIFLYVLTLIHPSIFQLLLNLRVVWTGVIFQLLLGRKLSKRQWIALFFLVVGCTIAQYSTSTSPTKPVQKTSKDAEIDQNPSVDIENSVTEVGRFVLGLALTLVYTFISTGASVVNEVMLKSSGSLHTANMQLYSYGILFNLLGMAYQARQDEGGYFRGWSNPLIWCVFFSMSFAGLLVSRVMQKYDNIIKIFCVSVSNFVVYFFSVLFDGLPLSFGFIVAFVVVSASALDYQKEKAAIESTNNSSSGNSSKNLDVKGEDKSSYHQAVVVGAEFNEAELTDDDAASLLMISTTGQIIEAPNGDLTEIDA